MINEKGIPESIFEVKTITVADSLDKYLSKGWSVVQYKGAFDIVIQREIKLSKNLINFLEKLKTFCISNSRSDSGKLIYLIIDFETGNIKEEDIKNLGSVNSFFKDLLNIFEILRVVKEDSTYYTDANSFNYVFSTLYKYYDNYLNY